MNYAASNQVKKPVTSRYEIYRALDGEREYQGQKFGDKPHSLTEFLVYIRDYTEEALTLVTRSADEDSKLDTLDSIRKIAALGVAALEQHGVQTREQEEARDIGITIDITEIFDSNPFEIFGHAYGGAGCSAGQSPKS